MDKARIDNTARWLQRWTAAVSTLAQSLDAERVAHWLGPVAAFGWERAPAQRRVRVIQAWSGWASMQVGALDPLANRLVVLAPDLLARVLMSRALFSRALALRRCIERERLSWFEQRVGPAVLDYVRHCAGTGMTAPLLPHDADQAAWIGDGWRRMQADGVWPDPASPRCWRCACRWALPVWCPSRQMARAMHSCGRCPPCCRSCHASLAEVHTGSGRP